MLFIGIKIALTYRFIQLRKNFNEHFFWKFYKRNKIEVKIVMKLTENKIFFIYYKPLKI